MPAIANVTCQNATTPDPRDEAKDDLDALLYIVVTLLFYSMGIIIGIITYLKREQAEMEEDKMFDMYMQLKREPFNLYKKERVHQMALYLKQLDEQREARERVENWRTAEGQQGGQQHHPACRQHGGRLHSPFLPGAEAWPGLVPLAGHDPEWGDTGGSAALLCSLTLGVCEPLLTPDTIKRVAFPDAPNDDAEPKSLCSYSAHQGAPQRCQCGSIKSSFKSKSGAKLAGLDEKSHQSAEHIYHNSAGANPNQHHTSPLLALAHVDSPKSICDIKDRDMRQMGETTTVFHNCSPCAGTDVYSCDRKAAETDPEPPLSPRQRSLSLTAPQLDYMQISRPLSLDIERKLSDLAVHSSSKTAVSVTEGGAAQTVGAINDKKSTNLNESPHQELHTERCSECKELEMGTAVNFCGVRENASLTGSPPNNQQPTLDMTKSPTAGASSASPLPLSPIALTQSVLYQIPLIDQPVRLADQPIPISLPLALLQLQSHVDVRPKVFPLRDIPKSLSLEDSRDPQGSEHAPAAPASNRRLHNVMYDSWKRGNSKTVDIPDVMQRSQPSPDNSLKPAVHYAKRSLPRIQPARDNERRGALFFTQKSLHKDDSPKTAGAAHHRHARSMGLVGRQESVDSSNSRTSELSDSPLLQPHNESTNALNLSSNSSSAGSASMSPPTISKHQGKIPRLSRSQTVDSSKLFKK